MSSQDDVTIPLLPAGEAIPTPTPPRFSAEGERIRTTMQRPADWCILSIGKSYVALFGEKKLEPPFPWETVDQADIVWSWQEAGLILRVTAARESVTLLSDRYLRLCIPRSNITYWLAGTTYLPMPSSVTCVTQICLDRPTAPSSVNVFRGFLG